MRYAAIRAAAASTMPCPQGARLGASASSQSTMSLTISSALALRLRRHRNTAKPTTARPPSPIARIGPRATPVAASAALQPLAAPPALPPPAPAAVPETGTRAAAPTIVPALELTSGVVRPMPALIRLRSRWRTWRGCYRLEHEKFRVLCKRAGTATAHVDVPKPRSVRRWICGPTPFPAANDARVAATGSWPTPSGCCGLYRAQVARTLTN